MIASFRTTGEAPVAGSLVHLHLSTSKCNAFPHAAVKHNRRSDDRSNTASLAAVELPNTSRLRSHRANPVNAAISRE
jgi:hypothetical protein